ncbi:MAG: fimbrillin family protein, partial [Muribaculaceae bacterium]|nr:fimbrillin family protein [Muribaculaceae bacterium]
MIRIHNHLLTGALSFGLLTLAACSSGDEPQPSPASEHSRPIRFAATALSTKADITTNSLSSFNVYAYTGNGTSPSVFMNNVTVSKSATNLWTYSPVEYWPVGKKVDFYAFAPAEWMDGFTPLNGIPYENYYADEDIIYAVSPDLQGNSGVPNAQVVFNFRHALSKITIKLSSTRDDLRVAVSNVAVAGLNMAGNFHFPSASTARTSGTDGDGYW